MKESQKTNKLRGPDFIGKHLTGKVIDIGAGNDLVCDWAERFDMEDGDANHILDHRTANMYDAVHSSHCLEHMFDPRDALKGWWDLVKPGGYLVLVVPDEDLYEQGIWPSRFNPDHKATFTLKKEKSWSPVSYNLIELVSALPQAEIVSAEVQDKDYDHSLMSKHSEQTVPREPYAYQILKQRVLPHLPGVRDRLTKSINVHLLKRYNIPIDQTWGEALAQIQIVVRKREDVK